MRSRTPLGLRLFFLLIELRLGAGRWALGVSWGRGLWSVPWRAKALALAWAVQTNSWHRILKREFGIGGPSRPQHTHTGVAIGSFEGRPLPLHRRPGASSIRCPVWRTVDLAGAKCAPARLRPRRLSEQSGDMSFR